MRVTHNMIVSNVLSNIQGNLSRLEHAQNQISTGQRYSKASENPTAVARIMDLRSSESRVEQYRRNADNAVAWLNATDAAIQSAGDAVQRARELAVSGGNDVLPQEEREAIAAEIDQLLAQVIDAANSKFNGSYLFSGRLTDTPAYAAGAPPTFQGDLNGIEREINDGVKIQINSAGPDVFASSMQVLTDLANDLRSNDGPAIRGRIADIDAAQDELLAQGSIVGARTNRIETQQDRLEASQVSLAHLRSQDEEIDMVEAIVRFNSEETVYNASLQAGARIMQPSLLDFLR
ncbi:MAG: flagellar hook-associated protein FlgL [Thermomicrobiales bacterium]